MDVCAEKGQGLPLNKIVSSELPAMGRNILALNVHPDIHRTVDVCGISHPKTFSLGCFSVPEHCPPPSVPPLKQSMIVIMIQWAAPRKCQGVYKTWVVKFLNRTPSISFPTGPEGHLNAVRQRLLRDNFRHSIQGRANPVFSKTCLCLSDTRHFRRFLGSEE